MQSTEPVLRHDHLHSYWLASCGVTSMTSGSPSSSTTLSPWSRIHQRSGELLRVHAIERTRPADFLAIDEMASDPRFAHRRRHLRAALAIALSAGARYFKFF